MNRLPLAFAAWLIMMCCVLPVACAEESTEEAAQTNTVQDFPRLCDLPLEDPGRGRLYAPSAALLGELRDLPDRIDLGSKRKPEAAADVVPPQQEQPVQDVTEQPVAEQPVPKESWVSVLDGPVVDQEELAHVHLMAGSYEEAARIYRDLNQRTPGDAHLVVMLAVCERNAGHDAEARSLLAEVGKEGAAAPDWADWMKAVMRIGGDGGASE